MTLKASRRSGIRRSIYTEFISRLEVIVNLVNAADYDGGPIGTRPP